MHSHRRSANASFDGGHTQEDRSRLPRLIRLLDREVSAYAPGGRVAWRKSYTKLRKGRPLAARQVKPRIHPDLLAQNQATRNVLLPSGNLLRREVAQFALALLLQIEDSFPRFFEQVPFGSQITLIQTLNSWPEAEFVKRAKSLTVWGFARLMKQDLPDVPNAEECRRLGFQGKAAQWVRNLFVRRSNPRNVRFFWGLLQGVKRASAPISEEFISEAYQKHKKALTKDLGAMKVDDSELWKFGHQLWRGAESVSELPPPSFSASFRSSRAQGGKLAEIRNVCVDQNRETVLVQDRGGELRRAETVDPTTAEALSYYLQTEDRRRTRVQMVVEPLKARPITAGSALGSWLSMKGQREMWRHLRKYPQFSLIGEPLTAEHLDRLERESPKEFDSWVSGDFSAATDNLDIRVTKRLFESFLYWQDVPEDLETVYREMLYEQTLVYPDGSEVEQTTGQLMGSPLSFPILCAANLFCYAETWRKVFGRRCKLRDLPVLINGDDILFKADRFFYEAWQREVKKVGFELSVGKSYFASNFLTVNSKLYVCKRKAEPSKDPAGPVDGCETKCDVKTFELVSFFNPAQVLPGAWTSSEKNDVYKQAEEAGTDPFIGRLSDLLKRAADPRLAFERFKWFNAPTVRQATQDGRLNLFAPVNLGGLGAEAPECLEVWFTRFQRQLATKLHAHQQAGIVSLTGSTSLSGFVPVSCALRAVRATVPPAPSSFLPSRFGHDLDRSGLAFWKVAKIPSFGALRAPSARLMTKDEILNYVGTTEIAPTDENEEILINQLWAESLGLGFARKKGSVAGNHLHRF